MPLDLGKVFFALASILLLLLLLAQLKIWKKGTSSFVLLTATTATLAWCLSLLFQSSFSPSWFYLIPLLEILKNMSWFALLLSVLGIRKLAFPGKGKANGKKGLTVLVTITLGIPLALLGYLVLSVLFQGAVLLLPNYGGKNVFFGFLVTSIAGLALLEQVIRNTRAHHQWHLKFLVIGLGILFSYDLYLYSDALLFNRIEIRLWQIRGAIVTIATPFIAIAVLRTRQQPIQMNISRRLVFHTGVLIAAGLYLLLMSSVGFYIQNFSGEWGSLLQVLFWACSLSFLAMLIFSGRMRSLIKVYISRNLFSSKYDYRDEWMRISQTLSQKDIDESLPERAIHALANIVDSPAGALWLTSNDTHYDQVAQLEMGWVESSGLNKEDYLIRCLIEQNRVIDLLDHEIEIEELPPWLNQLSKAWLIVPLELHGSLLGFVLLKESRVEYKLNWEDYDLLKAAGQQTASYIAQMITSEALSEARQFNAFNQGSAFVVHDIKTLNSQLSMLVSNSEKHRDNPAFIEDMIKTTEHAVKKMDFLLKHFKNDDRNENKGLEKVNLAELVGQIVQSQSKLQPVPMFNSTESFIGVLASESELKSGIGHLIQNAQEATPDDGRVDVLLSKSEEYALLIIRDTGGGMTQEFIQTRLFKPFESTKGLAGMGIGVFQSRDYIRNLGGDLEVKSEPGKGTEFTIKIPLTIGI